MKALSWILLALLLVLPVQARAPKHYDFDGLDLAVWEPPSRQGLAPVLIFSHGYGGSNTQSTQILSLLAEHGYWVVAPNHRDARRRGRPQERFGQPASWTDQTYLDRAQDLQKVVTVLQTREPFEGRVDLQRLGLIGHSLGGYTVLGVAGGWPGWRLPVQPRAVLAYSPFCSPYVTRKTLGGLSCPVMFQGGTLDLGITPTVKRSGGAYDQAPAPKVLVEFERAGHLAWTDFDQQHRQLIVSYSLQFLDRYLANTPTTWTRVEGVKQLKVSEPEGSRARSSTALRIPSRPAGPR